MAGQTNIRQGGAATPRVTDPSQDLNLDFDDELEDVAEAGLDAIESDKVIFAKSTDIRRRLEEKLEVRLIKDQLGVDDFDF